MPEEFFFFFLWCVTNLEALVMKYLICLGMESYVHKAGFEKTCSSGLQNLILGIQCLEQNAQCGLNTWHCQYLCTQCSLSIPRCSAPERKPKQQELPAVILLCTAQDSRTITVSGKLNLHRELNQLIKKKKKSNMPFPIKHKNFKHTNSQSHSKR